MIRPMPTGFLLVLLTFTAAEACAQTTGDIPLTLETALARAMEANPRIQALQAGTQAQESFARSEKNSWLGELQFQGGVALNGDDTLIRPITSRMLASGVANMPFDDRYAFWSLAYRLPLFTGGSLGGTRNSARLMAEASRLGTQRSLLDVRHRVLATYLDLLSTEAGIHAWQMELATLDSLVAHIELGRKAGKYSRVDLLKARVEQQNTVAKTQALQTARETGYASLLALMGEEPGPENRYLLMPVAQVDTFTFPLDSEALVDSALVWRSDLKALRERAAAQRYTASATGGGRWPQVSIGGNFSGAHGGSIDFDDTYWSVNATVSMPLLDMGRRNNLTRKADFEARSAEMDVKDLAGRIRAEVASAQAAVTNARNSIIIQETTLELAAEISRLERLRYDAGRSDIDNLLSALSNRAMAEAALTKARNDLLIARDHLQLTIEGDYR